MFTKAIKQTAYAILATVTMSIGSAGLTSSAQAAPININPIPTTQTTQNGDVVQVGFKRGFRSHRGGHRGRSFHRGHRSSFRGHGRSFNRGHFKSSRYSRHGRFNRGGHHFKGHRFSRHGGFRR